jgi:hypothetical protein
MLSKAIILFTTLLLYISIGQAAEYSLAIQPILSPDEIKKSYQPLADYLSKETGQTISISTHRTFITYWNEMRKKKKGFDLVLDAAHFTDYRIQNLGYKILAKLPDTVSFSIVTKEDNFILDVNELISSRIATMPSPSLGALRLEDLFPNPMRIPNYVWKLNSAVAAENVLSGKVDAAIIPTRLTSTFEGLNTVMTTEPVPHMALSASPDVPQDVAEKIRMVLLNASSTAEGQKMLSLLKVDKFETSDDTAYSGYSALLKDVYGY